MKLYIMYKNKGVYTFIQNFIFKNQLLSLYILIFLEISYFALKPHYLIV